MSRIVAGRRGGHRLVMPSHDRTRPTSDRVRESAFNLIAAWAGSSGESADTQLEGFSFLDLYAGSAAVALEAASRGAGPAVAVERDAATASVARRNVAALDLPVSVVAASVDAYLTDREPTPFDVVWLDPPYAVSSDAVARLAVVLLKRGWLADDGLLVAERSTRDAAPSWPPELRNTWSRRYGETTLHFATKEDS